MSPLPPIQPNTSLIAGLGCLHAIAMSNGPLGVRELARNLGMEPTRAHRLMRTLASEGYLIQNAARKYEPGPGMHLISGRSLHNSRTVRRARQTLETLRCFNSSVVVGMLWRTEVVYLSHSTPGKSAASDHDRQPVFPASCSSIGLALLARRSDAEVVALYPESVPGFISREALLAELGRIRETGYASVAFGPVVSLGCSVDAHHGVALGSVSPDREHEAAGALKLAAKQIAESPSDAVAKRRQADRPLSPV